MARVTKSNNSGNVNRKAVKPNMRSKATIQRLKMMNEKPIRDKDGKLIGGHLVLNTTAGGKEIKGQARIAPDRRWFGNTRVIGQKELDDLRDKVSVNNNDPYSFVMRRKKIPMSLLQENENKVAKVNLLENESFESVFSKNNRRKRPKLTDVDGDYAALMARVQESHNNMTAAQRYVGDADAESAHAGEFVTDNIKDDLYSKGQSKRIWTELYKVLDCSDVVIQVVDARNVPGTRSLHIERHIKKNASHKQMIIVINKADLVPSWVVRKWVKILSASHPTVAFHASINNAFGKGALISLLRQFSKLHADKRQISVGIIGYPNVGKSSIINTLKGERCCRAAPIPGETKVWQYVTLTKKIFLIDSPGVVYDVGDDETETVLKGVVRSERLKSPSDFVEPMLARLKPEYIERVYGVREWSNTDDFLLKMARLKGKLLPNGEPDGDTIAKMMINDWQRGKLPYFVPPPRQEADSDEEEEEEEELVVADDDEDRDGEVVPGAATAVLELVDSEDEDNMESEE